ncbi:TOX high mobility group box family member 4-A-like isoform X2 [Centruroides vittatus]|uniref:TOX high mobility group box family member 4-A-like isoform X2 n=1 Tax=Centruroides vittatus TaxID=120091 RepID=UPI0035100CB0
MAQLYDQYVYKPADNFDLSLNISEDDCSATRQRGGTYMSLDQTFHTPSFGDEEFDIPPLQLPPADHQASTGEADVYRRPPTGAPPDSAVDPSVPSTDPLNSGYVSAAVSEASADRSDVRPGARDYGLPPPPRYPDSAEARRPPPGRTRPPSEACRSSVGAVAVHPSPADSVHASPRLETSEDSDDSTPLSQLMGSVKRPSPEPPDRMEAIKSSAAKKPKPQKKKKKRDPNEPQKPVSAYALFFRDRQAAIKGQNPNATFGEVSKIVASLWDSLDADHKNVYKKKTEAAKKEYLKALAAYRASLVSKAAADQSDSLYGSMTSPNSTVSSGASSSPDRGQNLSPIQKKSPLLSSLMENAPSPVMTTMNAVSPPHSSVVTSQVWAMPISPTAAIHQSSPMVQTNMTDVSTSNMTQQISSPPLMQSSQVMQAVQNNNNNLNQSIANSSYTQNMVNSPSPPHIPQSSNLSQLPISQSPLQTCLRHGCNNPPIDSPDWDREYCSNECVVSHCRDVFTAWVASRQAANSYASVK